MNLLLLALQEAADPAEPEVFGIHAGTMLWTWIIFIVLFIVLWWKAYPHILGYAAAREKRIQDALDDAARQREETQKLLEQQRAELANARTQAQALIAEGKTAAD